MKISRLLIGVMFLGSSLPSLDEKEELIYLNLGPLPSERRIYDAEMQILNNTLAAMRIQKQKWTQFAGMNISYVVKQETVSATQADPCGTLPIRVILKDRRLSSATYAASGGECKQGQSVSSELKQSYGLFLTPDDLYLRIKLAEEQLKCYLGKGEEHCTPTALSVTYDERFGFPIKMEDHGQPVFDYSWSLEVTDLEVAQ